MPPRIDSRIAVRWLLRCTILALTSIAVWSTLFSRFSDTSLHAPKANGVQKENKKVANALVVASLKKDDNSWLEDEGIQRNLEGWERRIYIVDTEGGGEGDLRVPMNRGREGMVYLTWVKENARELYEGNADQANLDSHIIDNYDNLPNLTIFLHSQRYQWHNDDPIYGKAPSLFSPQSVSNPPTITNTPLPDGIPILQNLKLDHVYSEGYANLRCGWTLGCPAEMRPNKELFDSSDKESETNYRAAFLELFPGVPVPDIIGVGCCAQ